MIAIVNFCHDRRFCEMMEIMSFCLYYPIVRQVGAAQTGVAKFNSITEGLFYDSPRPVRTNFDRLFSIEASRRFGHMLVDRA